MKKKTAKPRKPHPPEGLSESSAALWRAILADDKCCTAGLQELLSLALSVRDRIAELRALVRGEGFVDENLTTRTRHQSPAAQLLLESERQFFKLWTTLDLDAAPASYSTSPAELDELLESWGND